MRTASLIIRERLDSCPTCKTRNDLRFPQVDDRDRAIAVIGDQSDVSIRRKCESHRRFAHGEHLLVSMRIGRAEYVDQTFVEFIASTLEPSGV